MSTAHDLARLERAWQLHTQLQTLLEALPTTQAAQRVGAALWREGDAAYAHLDVEALAMVLGKMRALHLSLETGAVGFCGGRRRPPKDAIARSALDKSTPNTPKMQRTAAGPGLPGWGRSRWRQHRVTYCGPRDAPPLQCPWGPEPPVSPPRQSDPVTVARYEGPRFVDPWLARVRAEADGEAEALRRHGVPQYHGPDEPVTYVFPGVE
jgi:hypothetical protein